MSTTFLLTIALFAPLVSAGLIWMFFRKQGTIAAGLSVLASLVIATVAVLLAFGGHLEGNSLHNVEWISLGSLTIEMGFLVNSMTAMMLFVVGFVGFWIHIFSLGYMHDDAAKARYFGGLSIFMFSMLGIVLASNLIMVFVFWELVGFSSYMLINHYFSKQSAADASKKAFITNRVGDFGFLIGIVWTFWAFGTTDLLSLQTLALANPELAVTGLGLCLFCGVLGKSAQMPLHVWLPDAMEGPTPVSALIHAATMVAAGVYFLCRTYFLYSVEALDVIMWVGAITAIYAGFCALAQSDIKKILAYSTLSQLGYMVAAFALGTQLGKENIGEFALTAGVGAAMFHLVTHAFFKALLFLGSGSVIHACHHEQNIFKMGGLLKKMPITAITFLVGTVALAGVPFIAAGFFSKDIILYVAKEGNQAIFIILTLCAFLTATYMGRLYGIAFLGKPNSENAEHAHESGIVMTLPLIVLTILSVVGGYAFFYIQGLIGFYEFVPHAHGATHTTLVIISAITSILGLVIGLFFYGFGAKEDRLQKMASPVYGLLKSKLYIDEIYNWYVAKIQQRIADILAFLDELLISGLAVRGSAGLVGLFGLGARFSHVGSIHGYVYWFLIGVVVLYGFATGWF